MASRACPHCGADVPDRSVNFERNIGICAACNTIFQLEARSLGDVTLPERFHVSQTSEELNIQIPWKSRAANFVAAVALVWVITALIWMTLGVVVEEPLVILAGIPHVLVAIGVTYYAAALFRNTTTVRVRHTGILSTHTPLPLAADNFVQAEQIVAVRGRQHYHGDEKRGLYSYDLFAVLKDQDKPDVFITGLDEPEQAFWFGQAVEAALWKS